MLHMTMQPLIDQVWQRLEQVQTELQERHPQTTWLMGKGTLGTDYHLWLDADFPDRAPGGGSAVTLLISFSELETAPTLGADIAWEDGSVEALWQGGPVPWSLAAGSQLLADLPRLLQVFAAAVERGGPSNQTR